MDMGSKNDTEQQKRNKDAVNFQSPNMSMNWQLSGNNLTNLSMVMIPNSNPLVDSNFPAIWDRPTTLPPLSFYGNSAQINACTMNQHQTATIGSDPARGGMNWNPPNAMLKGAMLVPPIPGTIPQSLAQLPADSGFIERAARFSCFSGGNFSDIMNSLSVPEYSKPCNRAPTSTWRPEEVFASNELNSPSIVGSRKQNMQSGVNNSSKDVSLPNENRANEQSPLMNEKKNEGKESVGLSGNESDEAECSGRQEEMGSTGLESFAKDLGSRKRKGYGQDTELDRMKGAEQLPAKPEEEQTETQKGDVSLNSPSSKHGGKNSKQKSQSSDPPKEEYIHVRARRGQATNSHSLAERVRREKISERMKFLQDLVPGCDKVTGKAVMLDEIINYVQSLQRQVEFLSMKLSTVNPQLDFNLDGLLGKDSQAGSSSSLAFPPDNMTMTYNSLHGWQSGMLQPGFPGDVDAFRRSINSQFTSMSGGYRDPSSQAPNVWDAQLHNVVDMGFNSTAPLDSQYLSSVPPDQMKAEP